MISFERIFREKRSMMLPLLIALAVNIALFVLAVLPLRQSVSSEESRALQASTARREAEREHARAQAIVNGKARADRELARFYGQVLPANQSGAVRITYVNLHQLARNAGLTVDGQQNPGAREPDEPGGLTTFRTELRVSGQYRGIRQFIYALESQPAFLVIESLEVTSATAGDQPLQVVVRIATYYRAADGG